LILLIDIFGIFLFNFSSLPGGQVWQSLFSSPVHVLQEGWHPSQTPWSACTQTEIRTTQEEQTTNKQEVQTTTKQEARTIHKPEEQTTAQQEKTTKSKVQQFTIALDCCDTNTNNIYNIVTTSYLYHFYTASRDIAPMSAAPDRCRRSG
jgi:hypothetical protein